MLSDVAVLIVTHNHLQYFDKLLSSVRRLSGAEIYFCDANSTDGTKDRLATISEEFGVLVKDKLEGFSKNNNDLIRHFNINKKFYLLLNPDVYFDRPAIELLLTILLKHKDAAIAAPRLLFPSGESQKSWRRYPNLAGFIKRRLGFGGDSSSTFPALESGVYDIEWALGACLLVKSELLEGGLLLDERYRLYCEDSDICFRAKMAGRKVVGVEESVVFHHLQESSRNVFSRYNFWNVQSAIRFMLKWKMDYLRLLFRLRFDECKLEDFPNRGS